MDYNLFDGYREYCNLLDVLYKLDLYKVFPDVWDEIGYLKKCGKGKIIPRI